MNEKFRVFVKQRLKDIGMTQETLADRLSVTPSQISRLISGERGTTLDNLLALADAIQVNRKELLSVAAGLQIDSGKDPWVEDMTHKIKLVPAPFRGLVSGVIDSAIRGEEAENSGKPKPVRRGVK